MNHMADVTLINKMRKCQLCSWPVIYQFIKTQYGLMYFIFHVKLWHAVLLQTC